MEKRGKEAKLAMCGRRPLNLIIMIIEALLYSQIGKPQLGDMGHPWPVATETRKQIKTCYLRGGRSRQLVARGLRLLLRRLPTWLLSAGPGVLNCDRTSRIELLGQLQHTERPVHKKRGP